MSEICHTNGKNGPFWGHVVIEGRDVESLQVNTLAVNNDLLSVVSMTLSFVFKALRVSVEVGYGVSLGYGLHAMVSASRSMMFSLRNSHVNSNTVVWQQFEVYRNFLLEVQCPIALLPPSFFALVLISDCSLSFFRLISTAPISDEYLDSNAMTMAPLV